MRFSIVIPTYNSKQLLNNTLEALNYQLGYGFDDYEVVVSDDGSTDKTFDCIKNTPRNYSMRYVYLDRCAQSCRSRTRNEGRKAASGEIIVYLDSDILVRNDFLSEVNRYFKMNDRFLLLGTRLMLNDPIIFDDIKTQKVFDQYAFNPHRYDILEFRHYLFEQYSYNANAILFPWMQVYSNIVIAAKKWLDETGGFDENMKKWGMEDLELGYSLIQHGLQIAINPRLVGLHQNHGPRNDLIIEKNKEQAYGENIDYFIAKHPRALGLRRTISHKCLRGEIPMHKFDLYFPKKDVYFTYEPGKNIDELKTEITHYANAEGFSVLVEDFKEDADLDLWVQSLGKTKSVIRYYPQSKRLNLKEFEAFLDKERQRQFVRDAAKPATPSQVSIPGVRSFEC
jgi:glycosyltransferase involved in cell wall biosynthesis